MIGPQQRPRASARKSYGEYKPIIVHSDGRTEILGKRERPLIWRGKEPLPGGPTHFVRGKTFATRYEAEEFADRVINKRIQSAREAMERFLACRAKAQGGAAK
jgi:hypothetical protein